MGLKKSARWAVRGLLAVVILVVAAVAAMFVFQPRLDLSRWAPALASRLSAATGCELNLGGLWLVPSLRPSVELNDLTIRAATGEGTGDLAAIRSMRVRVALFPLFQREVCLIDAEVSDGRVHLDAAWPRSADGEPASRPATGTWRLGEIRNLSLRNLQFTMPDVAESPGRRIEVTQGNVRALQGKPVALEVEGALDGICYAFSATGGTIAQVLDAKSAWPLDAHMALADLEAVAQGTLGPFSLDPSFNLLLSCRGSGFNGVADLAGMDIPSMGAFRFEGRAAGAGTMIALSEVAAVFGDTDLGGAVSIDWSGDRPALVGHLVSGTLDLSPWAPGTPQAAPSQPRDPARLMGLARALDVDLAVTVDQVRGVDLDVYDADFRMKLDSGAIELPGSLRVGDVRVRASLRMDASREVPTVSADLRAEGGTLKDAWPALRARSELQSRVGLVEVEASSEGTGARELLENLALRVHVKDTMLRHTDPSAGKDIQLRIMNTEVDAPRGGRLSLSGKAEILDVPLHLEAHGPPVAALLEQGVRHLDVAVGGPWGRLAVEGAYGSARASGTGERSDTLDLAFTATGEMIGDLSAWLGVSADARFPYEVRGRFLARPALRELTLDRFRIGRTSLSGRAARTSEANGTDLYSAAAAVSTVDLGELTALGVGPASDAKQEALSLDVPVIPGKLAIENADLELTVDRLLREPTDITNIKLAARMRDGAIEQAPFSMQLGETGFSGGLSLRFDDGVPALAMNLGARDVDLGDLAKSDRFATGLDLTAESVRFELQTRGATLRDILTKGALSGVAEHARWILREPSTGKSHTVELVHADFETSAGTPLRIRADARLQDVPLALEYDLTPHREDGEELSTVDTRLRATGPTATIEVGAEAALPIDFRQVRFRFVGQGERLDRLGSVLGVGLPALGPYRVSGDLQTDRGVYVVPDLNVTVGESDIGGRLEFDLRGDRPRFAAELASERLRIHDFLEPEPDPNAGHPSAKSSPLPTSKGGTPASAFDAIVNLSIDRVLSHDDELGRGTLHLVTDDGRLELHSARIEGELGTASARCVYERGEGTTWAELGISLDRFDYGALLRSRAPGSRTEGVISLDLACRSQAGPGETLLSNSDGDLRFTVVPEGVSSKGLDLWAVGLISAIFDTFTSREAPTVNCLAGRFTLRRGVLRTDELILDTSRIRARGKGTIDLVRRKIDLRMRPRPKRTSFLSLATPIAVKGSLEDPSIRIATGGVLTTLFRVYMWSLAVIGDLFSKPLPADGADVCVWCAEPPATRLSGILGGDRPVPLR